MNLKFFDLILICMCVHGVHFNVLIFSLQIRKRKSFCFSDKWRIFRYFLKFSSLKNKCFYFISTETIRKIIQSPSSIFICLYCKNLSILFNFVPSQKMRLNREKKMWRTHSHELWCALLIYKLFVPFRSFLLFSCSSIFRP